MRLTSVLQPPLFALPAACSFFRLIGNLCKAGGNYFIATCICNNRLNSPVSV